MCDDDDVSKGGTPKIAQFKKTLFKKGLCSKMYKIQRDRRNPGSCFRYAKSDGEAREPRENGKDE